MKNIFTAQKTVLALAVAGLISSGAFAATQNAVTIQEGSSLVIKNEAYTATGNVITNKDTGAKWAAGDTLGGESVVTLDNGTFSTLQYGTFGSFYAVKSVTGVGTVQIGALQTKSATNVDGSLTVDSVVNNADNIVFEFLTNADGTGTDKTGTATLKLRAADSNTAQLGKVDETNSALNALVTLKVAEGTKAVVTGDDQTSVSELDLANVAFQNMGEMTLGGTGVAVTLGSVLDNTAAGNTGKYTFAGDLTVAGETGSITTTETYMGTPASTDKPSMVFSGNVTVGDTSATDNDPSYSFTADKLTVNSDGKTFKVDNHGVATLGTVDLKKGTFETATGGKLTVSDTMTVDGGTLTLGGENTIGTLNIVTGTSNTVTGSTTLTNLTVGSNAVGTTAAATLEVTGGEFFKANTVTVNALDGTYKGTLTLNAGSTDFEFGTVDVKAGGTVALTNAESAKFGTVNLADNASDLVSTLTVSDGDANQIDTFNVGKKASATISRGKTTIGDLTTAEGSNVTISGGEVAITGKLTAYGVAGSGGAADSGDTFKVTGGTLTTSWGNVSKTSIADLNKIVATPAQGTTNPKVEEALGVDIGVDITGLNITDELDYTVAQYEAAVDGLIDDSAAKTSLHFVNGNFVGEAGKLASFADVAKVGNNVAHSTVSQAVDSDAAATTAKVTGGSAVVGAIQLDKHADAKTDQKLTSASFESLTFRGNEAGEFIKFGTGVTLADNTPVTLKDVTLGVEAEDGGAYSGIVSIDAANDGGLTVENGAWTLGNFVGSKALKVNGGMLTVLGNETEYSYTPVGSTTETKYNVLTIGSYSYKDTDGKVKETDSPFSGDFEISGGATFVAGNYGDQAQAVYAKLAAADLADEQFDDPAANYTADDITTNLLYIGEETKFAKAPSLQASAQLVHNYVYIDLNSVAAKASYTAENGIVHADEAIALSETDGTDDRIVLANLNKNVVTVADDGSKYIKLGDVSGYYTFGNSFYLDGKVTEAGNADITVDASEVADLVALNFHSTESALQQIYNFEGANSFAQTIINNWDAWGDQIDNDIYQKALASGMIDSTVTSAEFLSALEDAQHPENADSYAAIMGYLNQGYTVEDVLMMANGVENAVVADIVAAEHAQTNMAVLGGAFSTSFDINDQIRNTIDRRSSLANLNVARNATGITPWVDVMGTWNTADGLYGSSGYEADIYGATLGADYTASCGAILGAAISIGQADANSVDASTKVDNDVDFWGVSFYGSHRIGNVNGKFDIGYVSTSNDLSSSSAYFGTVKESLDADIFTVGVGAEYLATVGSLNVVPHAGIRWSSLDMDDSKYGADYDKMNLFQMPIGVAFSGTFDMTGWKVAPMLDISVVPTFGDKDAVASYAGGIQETVRVVDSNPVQMTLGVNATVDAWTLGVNYGLSAGSDERLNNAFNFNARYTF